MDLTWSEQDERFRSELRAWIAQALPQLPSQPKREDWQARRERDTTWQRMLYDAGYAGINWPSEFGGRGASLSEQLVFYEEITKAGAPDVGVNFVGLLHAGPTLIAEATEEQRAGHLPAILKGDEVWCQGFSEPSAGSDLASLSARAVRDGDDYVITGQKIWTSFAQVSDYCELLVRTDPEAPKHKGITWLIMPMETPGVEVRPLRTVIGSSEFSELYLDEVRVPVVNRVGEENDGWRVAMVTFSFERGTSLVSEMVEARRQLDELVKVAKVVERGRGTAWDDTGLRREIGHAAAELDALWNMVKRTVSEAARTGVPGVGASVVKLYYTELIQRIGDLAMRVLDRASLSLDDVYDHSGHFVEERLRVLALTIAAGSSQIQRNIIGERILGLPRLDFTLSDDQVALQEGVRKLCEGRFPMDRVRQLAETGGVDRALWRELADAGVFSLRLAEADGGAELGMAEAALVFEELGRALVPGPLVWTHLAAGLIPGAAEGERVVGGLERHDEPFLVEYPDVIDVLLAVDDDGLWEVDRSRLSARPVDWPLDPLTPVHVAGGLLRGVRRGVPGDAVRWRFEGAVLTAAFMLGMAAVLTEMSVDYAKERQQFDKPIGSFQAIKHLLADMFVRTEVARAAVYAAAVNLDEPSLGPPARAVAGAKLLAGEAATLNGKTATQVHGGMGFTWEVDVHLYLKRAWALDTAFGTGDAHADTVAALLD